MAFTLEFCKMKIIGRMYSIIILHDAFSQPRVVLVFAVHVWTVEGLRVRQIQGWRWQWLRIRRGPGGTHRHMGTSHSLNLYMKPLQTWTTVGELRWFEELDKVASEGRISDQCHLWVLLPLSIIQTTWKAFIEVQFPVQTRPQDFKNTCML